MPHQILRDRNYLFRNRHPIAGAVVRLYKNIHNILQSFSKCDQLRHFDGKPLVGDTVHDDRLARLDARRTVRSVFELCHDHHYITALRPRQNSSNPATIMACLCGCWLQACWFLKSSRRARSFLSSPCKIIFPSGRSTSSGSPSPRSICTWATCSGSSRRKNPMGHAFSIGWSDG